MDGDRFYEDSKENVERLVTLDLFSMKKMRKWFDLRSLPGCSVTELMTIVQTIVTKDLETKSEKSRFSIEASTTVNTVVALEIFVSHSLSLND